MPPKRSTVRALWSRRVHRCGRSPRSCEGTDANGKVSIHLRGRFGRLGDACKAGIPARTRALAVADNDIVRFGAIGIGAGREKPERGREIAAGVAGFGKVLFAGV